MLRFLTMIAVLLSGSSAFAQEAVPAACERYAMKLDREFALWRQPTAAMVTEAAHEPGDQVPLLAPDRRYDIVLPAHAAVRFAASPERDRGGTERFSGLLALTVPQAGTWRIATSTPIWIDVVAGERLVPSSHVEMQAGCVPIHKVVEFPLEAGHRYWLQLSGNTTSNLQLIVTRRP